MCSYLMNLLDKYQYLRKSIPQQCLEILADVTHVAQASLRLEVVKLSIEAHLQVKDLGLDHVLDMLKLCWARVGGAAAMGNAMTVL